MNTNLRAMIDDALDGAYAHEQEYGYTETGDLGHVGYSDDGDAVKLAHALNYVATNLNDLGTTEEKIAELELFSEMMKEAASEEKAAADAAEKAGDTFGDYWKNLKGDSGIGAGKAWEQLSTGRKWALGGGAGLVGLGALYGGYKMLGGGDSPQNNIVKVSALQDAKMRAFEKVAQRYDIPVWELEKLALDRAQAGITSPTDRAAITEFKLPDNPTQLDQDKLRAYEQSMASRERGAKQLLGAKNGEGLSDVSKQTIEAYRKGEAVTSAQMTALREDLAANPTSNNAFQAGSRAQSRTKMKGGTPTATGGVYMQGPQNTVERVLSDGTKVRVPKNYEKTPIETIEGNTTKYTVPELATGDALKTERLQSAAGLDAATTPSSRRANAGGPKGSHYEAQRRTAAASRAEELMINNRVNSAVRSATKGAPPGTQKPLKAAIQAELAGRATAEQVALRRTYLGDEAFNLLSQEGATEVQLAGQRQGAVQKSRRRSRRGARRRAARIQSGAVQPSAAEAAAKTEAKELGFFAKNRRGLMAAGGLGAAGLAGYGLYRAMSGGQSKAAAFREFQKIAEDRINPARIRAGAAHNFSGFDIRSHGGGESRFDPVSLRAARVRAKINSDMGSYVSNVGGGYNLERYLNRFNR